MSITGPKIYIKDESFDPIYKTVNPRFYFKSRLLSVSLLSLGFLILGTQVIIPLVFFSTQEQKDISEPVRASVMGVATGFSDFEFKELDSYESESNPLQEEIPQYFYVTIPKLKIEEALAETNSTNLSPESSLGHYKGSALPGQTGNIFIYGHSVLSWFFNPKNYKTIFSTLDKLETGDEIILNYNSKDYKYKVEYEEVLKPTNINPLAEYKPKYLNESTLTLMTCWPAGTRNNRLLIRAVRVD